LFPRKFERQDED